MSAVRSVTVNWCVSLSNGFATSKSKICTSTQMASTSLVLETETAWMLVFSNSQLFFMERLPSSTAVFISHATAMLPWLWSRELTACNFQGALRIPTILRPWSVLEHRLQLDLAACTSMTEMEIRNVQKNRKAKLRDNNVFQPCHLAPTVPLLASLRTNHN